jgi:hypothetical protein
MKCNTLQQQFDQHCKMECIEPSSQQKSDVSIVKCGMYITPKKRPKFKYEQFILCAKGEGVDVGDINLDGPIENLPSNLDIIVHKVMMTRLILLPICNGKGTDYFEVKSFVYLNSLVHSFR